MCMCVKYKIISTRATANYYQLLLFPPVILETDWFDYSFPEKESFGIH